MAVQFMDLKPFTVRVPGSLKSAFGSPILDWTTDDTTGQGFANYQLESTLTDDSDATAISLGAYQDDFGNSVVDSVMASFQMPAGLRPLALLLRIRAKSNADVLASPPVGTRSLYYSLKSPSTGEFDKQVDGNRANLGLLAPLNDATAADPAWYTTYFPGHAPDLSNPTSAGYWLEVDTIPGLYEALTTPVGDMLDVSLGMFWLGDGTHYGPSTRRVFLDLFEFQLRVAYEAWGSPPEVIYPRNDGLATGSADVLYPQPDSYQASGLTYGGYW